MGEPSEIRVNLPFRGRQLAEFLAIKEHLGIETNADVVRYLVHRHARALQRRNVSPPRRQDARAQRGDEAEARPPGLEGDAPAERLCLDCPLPECDETDPRCPYQQATGERERQRARTRDYMRRVRAR